MSNTYYPQSDRPAPTMTVGQLIERLQAFDPNELVVFQSPQNGCFGPNTTYTIDAVEHEALKREEHFIPAGTSMDEETGEEYATEAWTQVFNAWSGVVIR